MINKAYIATSLDNRENAERLREELDLMGIEVTSNWSKDLTNTREKESKSTITDKALAAQSNFDDLDRAGCVIFLNHPTCGGSLIEAGYAHGKGYPIVCVEHVISHGSPFSNPIWLRRPLMLSNLMWVTSTDDVLTWISQQNFNEEVSAAQ